MNPPVTSASPSAFVRVPSRAASSTTSATLSGPVEPGLQYRLPAPTSLQNRAPHAAALPCPQPPPLMRLQRGEHQETVLEVLQARCASHGAPALVSAGVPYAATLGATMGPGGEALMLRGLTLALSSDTRLASLLAAERLSPSAPWWQIPPEITAYIETVETLRAAIGRSGVTLNGTYGFLTHTANLPTRVAAAPNAQLAGGIIHGSLHWQRGARDAIHGSSALMWPQAADDPLRPLTLAFALDEPTPDATTVLAELRELYPLPPAHTLQPPTPPC